MINLFVGNFGFTEVFFIFLIIIPLFFGLWIYAILELIKMKFDDQATKIIWALVILIFPLIGPIVFLLAGRKKT
jgi:hypothetical protein